MPSKPKRQRALVAAPPEAALALSGSPSMGGTRGKTEDEGAEDAATTTEQAPQRAVDDAIQGKHGRATRGLPILETGRGFKAAGPHLAALASREAAEAHKTSRPCNN